jgi:hypothetical protein
MTDETRFSVLVSIDEGVNWKLHRGIIANTTEQACKRVQATHYADKPEAIFYATQRFTPRKMVERMVPKLGMQQVELDPEPSAETVTPHQTPPHPAP